MRYKRVELVSATHLQAEANDLVGCAALTHSTGLESVPERLLRRTLISRPYDPSQEKVSFTLPNMRRTGERLKVFLRRAVLFFPFRLTPPRMDGATNRGNG